MVYLFAVQGLSRVFSKTTIRKHQLFDSQPTLWPLTSIHFSTVQSLIHVRLFVTPWLHHARPPCPSPTPGAYSNSCPLSWWCHPTISSFVVPFSSCLQSFPASGSFPMSQFFTSDGQRIVVSASASVFPEYLGLISFRMDWLDLLAIQGTPKSFLQHHSSKASILWSSAFFIVQLSHLYMTTGKTEASLQKETSQTHSIRPPSPRYQNQTKITHTQKEN